MASIQAKRGQDRLRVIQKKKVIVLIRSNPTRKRKFQKNCKEMQKIKKHHYGFISSENGMGQAEIDTKKKKVIIPIHSKLTQNREFQKSNKKIKNHPYGFIRSRNGTGQAESDTKKKKSYRSDPFQPDPELGFPKKQQRYEKKLRNIIVASFQAKTGRDRQRVIPKKKKLSFRSILT